MIVIKAILLTSRAKEKREYFIPLFSSPIARLATGDG